jgi:hypothetical protein
MEDADIGRKLSGKTLQVYRYLQRKKEPSGIRKVQRDLGLSSPSVADYQIEKLVGTGLAAKDRHGRVFVTRKVRVKALDSYVSLGRFSVPRLAFYASVFSAVSVLYALFDLSSLSVYGVAVPAAATAVLWLEAWRMWRFSLIERAQSPGPSERHALFRMLLPSIVAVAVLASAGAFLFQYTQQSSPVPVPVNAQYETESRLTPEESTEMSHQKVVAAGGTSSVSEPVMTGMIFAGAGVAGFLVYIVARYGRVLEPERLQQVASRTQDYPECLR